MLIPGAILDPGAHWSYQAGYTSCALDVWHYTVGNDSRALIRDRGLAAILVRDEGFYQYAPADAVCYTQCEWNREATATEVESIDGTITDAEVAHLAYVTLWKLATFGIPGEFYDGPRLPIGSGFRGVTNHRALEHRACDQHSDGFGVDVWERVVGSSSSTPKGVRDMHYVVTNGPAPGNPRTFKADGLLIVGEVDYGAPRGGYGIHREALDSGLPIVNGEAPLLFGPSGSRAVDLYVANAQPRAATGQVDVKKLAAEVVALLPTGTVVDAGEIAAAVRKAFHEDPLR